LSTDRFSHYYQRRYYAYQSISRGWRTEAQLKAASQDAADDYLSSLGRWLPGDRSSLCIDLPCGAGRFLYFLRTRGYSNAVGYDIDPHQISLARMLGLDASCGDAFEVLSSLPGEPALIASLDFLEHLDRDSAVRFLEACFCALRPGGALVLRTPCCDGPFGAHDRHNDITHEWGVTSNALRCLLGMVGFETIHVIDPLPPPISLYMFVRRQLSKVTRSAAGVVVRLMGLSPPAVWSRSFYAVAIKPLSPVGAIAQD